MSTTIIAQVTHSELDGTVTDEYTIAAEELGDFYRSYVKEGTMTEHSARLYEAEAKRKPGAAVQRATHIVNKRLAGEELDFLEQKIWHRLVIEVRDQLTAAGDERLPRGVAWLDGVHISQNPTQFAEELHQAAQRRGN